VIDGVVIARINTDTALADFEGGVRDRDGADVEEAYWDLYFAYRNLVAQKMGRDQRVGHVDQDGRLVSHRLAGRQAPTAEAQARAQYFVSVARSSRRCPICSRRRAPALRHGAERV